MANNKTYDWKKIKIEYVTTSISQRNLADKYNIPYSTLRNKCTSEKWFAERKKHSSKMVAKTMQKLCDREVDFLVAEYELCNDFVKLIENSVTDNKSYKELSFIDGTETGRTDTKAILNAAAALGKFIDMKRLILGAKTIQEQDNYELAKRKVEVEETKANKENSSDKEIKIILSDEVKEFTV